MAQDGSVPTPAAAAAAAAADGTSQAQRDLASAERRGAGDGADQHEEQDGSTQRTWKDGLRSFYERNFGLFLVFTAQTFGSVMSTAAKLLTSAGVENQLSALQIIFVRMLVTAVLGSAYMWFKRVPDFPLGPKGIRGLLVLRGLAGFTGLFGLYYSLSVLEISDAVVITFLVPTFTGVVCFIWLREPYTAREAAAGFIALIGVLLVARPPFLFGKKATEPILTLSTSSGDLARGAFDAASLTTYYSPLLASPTASQQPSPAERSVAVLVAILGTFSAATAYACIRVIGKRAHSLVSVNYFAFMATLVSTVIILVHPDLHFVLPRGVKQWTLLTIIGVAGFLLQFLLTEGLQREKAGRATNLTYLQLVFTLVVERVIWGTTPPPISLAGAALIIGAAIWISLQKNSGNPTAKTHVAKADTGRSDEEAVVADEETALLGPREEDIRR